MFSACRRAEDAGATHFDVRWQDGVLQFTGRLQLLPQSGASHVQARPPLLTLPWPPLPHPPLALPSSPSLGLPSLP